MLTPGKTLIFSLAVLAAGLLFPGNIDAQCPPQNPATSMKYEIKPTRYIRNYSLEELNTMHNPAYGSIMALAESETGMNFNVTFEAVPYQPGRNVYCLKVKTVRATFSAMPAIYIAENFGRGTCEYAAVLKHELKHVKMLKQVHKDSVQDFRDYLNVSAKNIPILGPIPLSGINKQKQNVIEYLKNRLQNYIQIVTQEVSDRQREIDTHEEYTRLWQHCDQWDRE